MGLPIAKGRFQTFRRPAGIIVAGVYINDLKDVTYAQAVEESV